MVIQRWQTVWLLIAAILACVFCFVPMALVRGDELNPESVTMLMPKDFLGILIIDVVAAVLLLLTIFMYRNLKRQKSMTLLSMLLLVVTIVTEALTIFNWDTEAGKIEWMGSVFLLVGSVVFAFMALRGIRHDDNLLRAADRLR